MLLASARTFPESVIAIGLIAVGIISLAPLSRVAAAFVEKRQRRKQWEAKRFPSWEAPASPFYLGD